MNYNGKLAITWTTFKHYTRINMMMDRKQRFFTKKIYDSLDAKG
jgi:hypothetical protein